MSTKCELCGKEIHSFTSMSVYRKGDVVVVVATSQEGLFRDDEKLDADEKIFEERVGQSDKFIAGLIESGFVAGEVAHECLVG